MEKVSFGLIRMMSSASVRALTRKSLLIVSRRCASQQVSYFGNRKRHFPVLDGNIPLSQLEYDASQQIAEEQKERYDSKMSQVLAGGGESSVHRHVNVNKKLLPRERVRLLMDDDYPTLELSPFAGLGMEYGDVVCAGGICLIGKISGQLSIVQVSDATVKGGTVYPIGVRKQIRMQEIAEQNRLPCVYVIDSGGAFLPLQAQLFPETGGQVFYNEARMNSLGIPQICLVAGSCTAGAAYIPTMANEVVMVDGVARIFLAGPPLVMAAIGEKISEEDLGGAHVHCEVSGCADYKAADEHAALEMTRDVMSALNVPDCLPGRARAEEPMFDSHDMPVLAVARGADGALHLSALLARILDGSRFHEFKPLWGTEIMCGFGHLEGVQVGVVANRGALNSNACLKAANFVSLCNERGVPILFLQDIAAETVEPPEDLGVRMKSTSALMSAVATAGVPKITLLMGGARGPGHYAMCGRGMGPNFLFAWPGATRAISTVDIEQSRDVTDASRLHKQLTTEAEAFYGSARIWDDGIILPQDTRHVLCLALTACVQHKPISRSADSNVMRL